MSLPMTDLAALVRKNAERWEKATITRSDFSSVARRLLSQKARLQTMQALTRVPWFVIAVIKQRECGDDPNWMGNIANGERWDRKTTIVPEGRGPFISWEDAASDALRNCAPFASRWTDWSAGGALTLLEQYNGLGYAAKGVPSPYIWSGTDQYKSGKYVRDHVYDPDFVDKQLGCAGLLKAMAALDSSVRFGGGGAVVVAPIPPAPKPAPAATPAPAKPGWMEAIFSAILTAFRKKP